MGTERKGGILNFKDGPRTEEYVNALSKPAKVDDAPKTIQGKTVNQWTAEQQQFQDLPPLPPGWLRITSRKTSEVYFFNKWTQEAFPSSRAFFVPFVPLVQSVLSFVPLE